MADVVGDLVSDLISKGVEKIAARKSMTSQDLTVLLLHKQSSSIGRMEKAMERLETGMERLEKGMGRLEKGMEEIAHELREFRQDVVPLLNQGKAIADIQTRMERIEAKLN
jgi:predicted RNase H-like nuclease (RuvC/YqgF family)